MKFSGKKSVLILFALLLCVFMESVARDSSKYIMSPVDVPKCLIYGYAEHLLVAEVDNAVVDEVAYESFEYTTTASWSLAIPGIQTFGGRRSLTGLKFYNLSVGGVFRNFTTAPGKNMIVSYWSRSGPQSVSGSSSMQTGNSVTIDDFTWTFYEHLLINPESISVSGTGIIDELRLYPEDANMITYAHEPLVGITAECDINNSITFYEYDVFKRISVIRDQYFRILKRYCYGAAGQQEDCTTTLHASEEKTGNYTRNNCPSGYQGGTLTYTVPTGTYVSSVDLPTANQQAQNDLDANGPVYANINGACDYIYYSVDYSGTYYSGACLPGQTPQPIYVSVPPNSYTSLISQADADSKALQYAQNQADQNGGCITDMLLLYENQYYGTTIYIYLINLSTYEESFFELYYNGSGVLGSIPPGNYEIQIYDNVNATYRNYAVGCGNYQSGYGVSFYNVALNTSCNTISIY